MKEGKKGKGAKEKEKGGEREEEHKSKKRTHLYVTCKDNVLF